MGEGEILLPEKQVAFLPREVVLARYMLWPCVRLSVHHKLEFYQNG